MSSGFDALWLANFSAQKAERNPHHVPEEAVEVEADLQEQIERECRYRQWAYARTRMDRATTFTMPGVPDFIIAASRGRTLWVECKSRTGKQTTAQLGFELMVTRQGGDYRIIRTFPEFLEMANASVSRRIKDKQK